MMHYTPISNPWEENWEVIQHGIGAGGQGTTHLVRSKSDDSKAVMKVLNDTDRPQARKRMRLEVVALETLAEFGARVPVPLDNNFHDIDKIDVPLFFTMQFIEGQSLDSIVKEQGPFDLATAIDIVEQVSQTIAIGHRQKLLHRDIKPKNIMLSKNESGRMTVTVLDYGISFNDAHDEGLTTTHEKFRNEFLSLAETNVHGEDRRDFRTDVTALCGLLFFCLTRRYPEWLLDADARLPHRRPGVSFRDIEEHSDELMLLNSLLTRGFQPSADHRFQSVEEFLSNLELLRISANSDEQTTSFVARRESEVLRLHDRATQLAQIRPMVPKLYEQLLEAINSYVKQQQLDLFKVKRRQHRVTADEIENVAQRPEWLHSEGAVHILTTKHHSALREIMYALGVDGSELRVLRYYRNANPGKLEQPDVIATLPVNESLDFDFVVVDFAQWLGRSIVSLRKEILPDSVVVSP
jgi:serine/threonine protein kinase